MAQVVGMSGWERGFTCNENMDIISNIWGSSKETRRQFVILNKKGSVSTTENLVEMFVVNAKKIITISVTLQWSLIEVLDSFLTA